MMLTAKCNLLAIIFFLNQSKDNLKIVGDLKEMHMANSACAFFYSIHIPDNPSTTNIFLNKFSVLSVINLKNLTISK